jgi:hypothetical protein
MDLIHQLDAPTTGLPSGSPVVVMVQPTHDGKSNHLVSCTLSRWNPSALFRDLLPNPLMRSCLVEVHHIGIEDALELPLLQDQQVVQAFLPHTPGEALTEGIGSRRVIGGFEQLDATGRRHSAETGSILAVVITDQILGCLPIGCGFPERYAPPRHRSASGSPRHGSPCETSVR